MNKLIKEKHFAFNVWNLESAKAVMDAAALNHQDVIIQTSTSIYISLMPRIFSDFVKMYSERLGISAWLNLDHCKDKEILFDAIDNGWDMVMADGSSYKVDDNIDFFNLVTEYAHSKGVLVEGEVGQIKGVEDDLYVTKNAVAAEDDIRRFADKTEADFIAVAFGNAHGTYKTKPHFRYDLVDFTIDVSKKPFVVHGASGMSKDALEKILKIEKVKKINISTDLKNAYRRAIKKANSVMQPVEIANSIHDEIVDEVSKKMRLIGEGLSI